MIDIDLTEAVEEAARDRYEATEHMTCWPSLAEASKRVWRSDVEGAVFAASSIIARQVAEFIAAAIEAEAGRRRRVNDETAAAQGGMRSGMAEGVRLGHDLAAQIAREAVR